MYPCSQWTISTHLLAHASQLPLEGIATSRAGNADENVSAVKLKIECSCRRLPSGGLSARDRGVVLKH